MADLATLEKALRNADAAGDEDAARMFAQEITKMRSATPAQPEASTFDKALGSVPGRFAKGVVDPLIGIAQLGANVVGQGDWANKQVAELEAAKQRGMAAHGTEGFDWAGLIGSLAPGAAVAKGASLALPAAKTLLGRMGVGAATGGLTAAAQPVNKTENFAADKAMQAGGGAVIGGAIPLAVQAVQGLKAAAEPFYDAGRKAIIGRTLDKAAGGQSAQAIRALENARELVPGSRPTVAQASQNAGLASLERAATATSPEATVAAQMRMADQNAARTGVLRGIAGTEADRAFAGQMRKSSTAPLLNAIKNSQARVDPSRTVSMIDGLIKNSPGRTQLTNTLKQVKTSLFKDDGTLRSNASELYQGARKNITDLLNAKAGDGSKLNEAISRELSVVMKSLDHQIGRAEPAYKAFMHDYAEMSKPINRMDVGKKILEKATDKLTGENIRPESFGAALSDKTAQQATGFKRATLEKTMTPDQLRKLEAVRADIARAVTAQKSAGSAGSDTVKKLAYTNMIDRSGVPTFLREFAPTQMVGNFLARGADSVYGRANNEIAEQLAQTLMDPKAAAQVMRQVGPSRYAQIIDAMTRQATGAAGTAVGRSQ